MSRFRRAALGDDPGYTPGEQPPDGAGWLKLNTNESPLAPSPSVTAAIGEAAAGLARYPDPDAEPLRSALAAHHRVAPDQVMVANGADEVLDCCFRAFAANGDRVVLPSPSYSLLPVLARVFGALAVTPPLEADHAFPARLGTEPARLRVAVNPNSPTGVWMEPDALAELLDGADGVSVIDEAYCDFAPRSCLPLLGAHDSWLVVRTFSKAYALAGLRVGYAVGPAALIADLRAVKDSYPVDRCAIAGALAALADEAHHRSIVDTVRTQRARLTRRLRGAGWDVLPSQANFVFARPPGGDVGAAASRLGAARILVRRFEGDERYADRLRITVGSAEAVDRLLGALAA